MVIWLQEFGMQLLLWLLGLLDSLFAIFGAAAGITDVYGDTGKGEEPMSLGEYFLSLDGVQKAFWVIFIASIGICAVCTVVAIVKNIINAKGGERKSHARTIGQSLYTPIVTLFMAMLLTVGIGATNSLLGEIHSSINNGENMTMSREIINISVQSGYVYDTNNILGLNEYDENGDPTFISYLYEFQEDGSTGKPQYFPDCPDNPELPILKVIAGESNGSYLNIYKQKTDPLTGDVVVNDKGYTVYEIYNVNKLSPQKTDTGWVNDCDKTNISENIWSVSVRDIFGTHSDGMIFPKYWKHDGMIDPDCFNFLVAYLCSVILLVAIVGATLGLVKRLFDIVLLFIALPGISATIPLDDGAKFKLWRETVISKVFLAFGSVLAVNVFFIVAPQLWLVSISRGSTGFNFTDSVLRLILICGGALTISGGQLLFARLLGTSAEESREMGQSARTLFGGAAAALGGLKAAGRLAFGTKNANGQRVGGLIKGGASAIGTIGGGAVNAVGGAVGGQAYRNSKFGHGVSATQKALKGFGGSSGWIGTDRSTGGNTFGSAIGRGIGNLGSKVASSAPAQKTGLNNGIAGGIKTAATAPGNRRREQARRQIQSTVAAIGAEEARTAAKAQIPIPTAREVLPGFENGAIEPFDEQISLDDVLAHADDGTHDKPIKDVGQGDKS